MSTVQPGMFKRLNYGKDVLHAWETVEDIRDSRWCDLTRESFRRDPVASDTCVRLGQVHGFREPTPYFPISTAPSKLAQMLVLDRTCVPIMCGLRRERPAGL